MEFIIHKTGNGWTNTAGWKGHLEALPLGKYLVSIKSTKGRSNDQNAYYWAVVVPLVYEGLRQAGFDSVRNKEDAHEIMKALFLKVTEEKADIKIEKVLSTTELTTIGFAEYLMNISTWAIDYLGVSIPEPNQQMEFEL